jgi:hypothetical protein
MSYVQEPGSFGFAAHQGGYEIAAQKEKDGDSEIRGHQCDEARMSGKYQQETQCTNPVQ